jgi:hypothetical protein
MKNPPDHLRKILWEYDISTLKKNDPIVLERILSYGNMEDIRYIGLSRLGTYFDTKKPILDPKSQNFWSVIFQTSRTSPPSLHDMINHPTSRRSFG